MFPGRPAKKRGIVKPLSRARRLDDGTRLVVVTVKRRRRGLWLPEDVADCCRI